MEQTSKVTCRVGYRWWVHAVVWAARMLIQAGHALTDFAIERGCKITVEPQG